MFLSEWFRGRFIYFSYDKVNTITSKFCLYAQINYYDELHGLTVLQEAYNERTLTVWHYQSEDWLYWLVFAGLHFLCLFHIAQLKWVNEVHFNFESTVMELLLVQISEVKYFLVLFFHRIGFLLETLFQFF